MFYKQQEPISYLGENHQKAIMGGITKKIYPSSWFMMKITEDLSFEANVNA